MKRFDFDQYSEQWWAVRRGIPTASEMSKIMSPVARKFSTSAMGYICQLIGDLYDPMYGRHDEYASAAMKNGSMLEPEARKFYEWDRGVDVEQVGFCLSDCGRYGCSPDALVGDDGGLELKSPAHKTHVQWLWENVLPDEHKVQVHGCLIVTGRAWWDFMSYAPGLPPLLIRVTPDDFTDDLRTALEKFSTLYANVVDRLKLPPPPVMDTHEYTEADIPAMLS